MANEAQHATSITSAPASLIGNVLVNRYYKVMHQAPHLGYRFYLEESKLTRAEPHPATTAEPTTTLSGINGKIMSRDHVMRTEILSIDSQESLAGQVLVMVTGALHNASGLRRMFVQTFVLVPQEKRYYIYNDVFRFLDGSAESNQQLPSRLDGNNLPSTASLDQGIKEATTLTQPSKSSDIADSSDVHTSEHSSLRRQAILSKL
ncbi:hypothetical protein GOP47_0021514 [Adiantum capillus-veneris]|uniref:NTF2 domain-containing protein n=1 Tax=Adiantum capillus-veneris TaxID=13818 RepID=A0A9D4U8I7_ADICA|nr:hypothetical protein GOP47_0021514 [Adiantum capillus-veneris]